eukprot:13478880-Alexandrium_andersonii.AAC.1
MASSPKQALAAEAVSPALPSQHPATPWHGRPLAPMAPWTVSTHTVPSEANGDGSAQPCFPRRMWAGTRWLGSARAKTA